MRPNHWNLIRGVLAIALFGALPLHAAKPAPEKAGSKWTVYRSHSLGVRMAVPANWEPRKSSHALGFRCKISGEGYAAFGVIRTKSQKTIEQQVEDQFKSEGKPHDWTQRPSRIAGMRAIKIMSGMKADATMGVMSYYVETPKGPYLIQCQAPRHAWSYFNGIFASMLSKVQFVD